MSAFGLVEDVYLFGAPIVASEEEWRLAASVVGGRFVNAYSTRDWILGFFYRTTSLGRRSIAGLHPITGINALENVDVSDEVPGHNAYREVLPLLLHQLGVPVTSVELHADDPAATAEGQGASKEDRTMLAELERAAELLEEHEKKKKNIWPWRWGFWGSRPPAQTGEAPPTAPDDDVATAARELAELGVDVKEVPSTLPALVIAQDKQPPP
ncbi:hypothetical protein H4R21_006050 [Coemansia helicoidea]|uniref:Uncharacterized protein n=1 Tax=Coemansia helicoidea TaxID=1286919 RepID=A0ACC1KQ78_9FUNG|nr:hypothetical protein H4R21_006050 [Coemansia helicoidea]